VGGVRQLTGEHMAQGINMTAMCSQQTTKTHDKPHAIS